MAALSLLVLHGRSMDCLLLLSVMAGRGDEALLRTDVPSVVRHGRACPGHPRPFLRVQARGCPAQGGAGRVVRIGRSIPEFPPSSLRREHATVMAGRGAEALLRADVPAIHVLSCGSKDVDARHKAGHDEW